MAKPDSKNRKGPAGWPPRIPDACLEQRPTGRKQRPKERLFGSPVDKLAISILNERRLVAKLPGDSPRRTPSLPKIDFDGEER
jgi:hypothetical protein